MSGCRYLLGDDPDNGKVDAPTSDTAMPADANTDPKCGFGTALPQGGICLAELPAMQAALSGTIDTDTSSLCVQYSKGGGTYCVIAATSVAVSGNLRVVGSKPLVLIATGTLAVTASLDISSHTAVPSRGAGSDPAVGCNYGTPPNDGANPETRGGAGGSLRGKGGSGGLRNGQPPSTTSGVPGAVVTLTPPAALRGGCRGQDGFASGAALGGFGGGAIYLVSAAAINIEATAAVNASGAGGNGGGGGGTPRGGAGGGSGGMIVLEAPTVNVLGPVFADGGGGGEGGGTNNPGSYGFESDGTSRASGGNNGAANGSDGGAGSYGTVLDGLVGGNEGTDSGGGGGGGAGFIWIRAQGGSRTGPVSPPAIEI